MILQFTPFTPYCTFGCPAVAMSKKRKALPAVPAATEVEAWSGVEQSLRDMDQNTVSTGCF